MAHFYADCMGRARTPVGRIAGKSDDCRAHARSHTMGGLVELANSPDGGTREYDLMHVNITGGTQDPVAIAGMVVRQNFDENGKPGDIQITQLDRQILLMLTDEAWTELLRHEEVQAIIHQRVFLNLDKFQK